MDIHFKIKDIRQRKNVSQADMADKMSISLVSYSKIERGITELSVTRLYEIAKLLEVPVNELLGEPTQRFDNEKYDSLEARIKELEHWLKDNQRLQEFIDNGISSLISKLYSYQIECAKREKLGGEFNYATTTDHTIYAVPFEADRKKIFDKYFLTNPFIVSFIESEILDKNSRIVKEWRMFLEESKSKIV